MCLLVHSLGICKLKRNTCRDLVLQVNRLQLYGLPSGRRLRPPHVCLVDPSDYVLEPGFRIARVLQDSTDCRLTDHYRHRRNLQVLNIAISLPLSHCLLVTPCLVLACPFFVSPCLVCHSVNQPDNPSVRLSVCLALCRIALSCAVSSFPVLPCLVMLFYLLHCPLLPCLVLAFLVMSCLWVQSCPVLSRLVLSCPCLLVCLYVSIFVYLSICLSVCLSVCSSVRPSVCLPVCLSVGLDVCLSVCVSVCLSVFLSVWLSVNLFCLFSLFDCVFCLCVVFVCLLTCLLVCLVDCLFVRLVCVF